LISPEKRKIAVKLIIEANDSGARLWKACETLEISVSTFRRWRNGHYQDKRKGASKRVPRKLTPEEELQIINLCCKTEYREMNPYEIHASLLDKKIYIASISTFYRVLRKNGLIHNRGNTKPRVHHHAPPQRCATGVNQVWCWDITWIASTVRGFFYYAYVIIDIWDRSIVKWSIHDREDDELANELFTHAFRDNGSPDVFIHSDNGNPMKGLSLMALFSDLGITNSYSRPRVSNDNPFIESWFKTMKYNVSYPGKFSSIEDARAWFSDFVDFYNTSHSHSGLNFITPQNLRDGNYDSIAANRNKTMLDAFSRNPQRWSNKVKQLPAQHVVYLNPSADTRIRINRTKETIAS